MATNRINQALNGPNSQYQDPTQQYGAPPTSSAGSPAQPQQGPSGSGNSAIPPYSGNGTTYNGTLVTNSNGTSANAKGFSMGPNGPTLNGQTGSLRQNPDGSTVFVPGSTSTTNAQGTAQFPSWSTWSRNNANQPVTSYMASLLNSGDYSNPQAAIDYFNSQNIPGYGYGSGPEYVSSSNTVGMPGGYLEDSTGTWGWVNRTETPSNANPNVLNGAGTVSQNTGPDNTALINLLTQRANESLNINPQTDSIIQPQVADYAAQQTDQNRNALNQLAESSSPYSTGAVNTAATQLAEQGAKNTAGMQSALVQNELTARRTEIQNALSELGSVLTADQQLALQEELGKLDASLQQQQINSQNDQFAATYGLNAANQANYWAWKYATGQ